MIGEKIRKMRINRGISEAELARRCGMAPSTLHNIEKGVSRNPSWYIICKIAKVLDVSLDELNSVI